ncbi:MAG: VOC family protein [Phycisphaerales bacterium]|nr:VOC family protein [Phycisphaerales bacterium]
MEAVIDHLVFTAPSLEEGMSRIEEELGVRPVKGGQHPQWGTCNALLGLGEGMYLEVIARDPSLPEPEQGVPKIFAGGTQPRLATWAARSRNLERIRTIAGRARITLGEVIGGSRMRPDGEPLHWQLTDPFTSILHGVVPFFIDWGDSVHPSGLLPSGGKLRQLIVKHPFPGEASSVLADLGVEVAVHPSSQPGLMAVIDSPRGEVVLH